MDTFNACMCFFALIFIFKYTRIHLDTFWIQFHNNLLKRIGFEYFYKILEDNVFRITQLCSNVMVDIKLHRASDILKLFKVYSWS